MQLRTPQHPTKNLPLLLCTQRFYRCLVSCWRGFCSGCWGEGEGFLGEKEEVCWEVLAEVVDFGWGEGGEVGEGCC